MFINLVIKARDSNRSASEVGFFFSNTHKGTPVSSTWLLHFWNEINLWHYLTTFQLNYSLSNIGFWCIKPPLSFWNRSIQSHSTTSSILARTPPTYITTDIIMAIYLLDSIYVSNWLSILTGAFCLLISYNIIQFFLDPTLWGLIGRLCT